MPTKSALPLARRADVAGFGMAEHHGDGSALPMLVQSGNLSLEIWSSGGCRFTRRWSTIVIRQSKFTRMYSFKDDIMSKDSPITYHLQELAIARNQKSPFHAMPRFSENDTAILDIGCGIGQTLVASSLENGKLLVGIDIDLDSLIYGQRQFGYINFVNGTAECLPFQSESFDFVIARVSLPYTNIPKSLGEIEEY